jgi:hypothetical protein
MKVEEPNEGAEGELPEFHRYWDPIKKAFNTAGTSKSKHGEVDISQEDTKTEGG